MAETVRTLSKTLFPPSNYFPCRMFPGSLLRPSSSRLSETVGQATEREVYNEVMKKNGTTKGLLSGIRTLDTMQILLTHLPLFLMWHKLMWSKLISDS